jgi:hypothetical protein
MPSDETADALALEKHYTVAQIGKLWGWSPAKVRTEEGVLQSQLRQPGGRKSQQVTLTIPESVLLRVHGRLGIGG